MATQGEDLDLEQEIARLEAERNDLAERLTNCSEDDEDEYQRILAAKKENKKQLRKVQKRKHYRERRQQQLEQNQLTTMNTTTDNNNNNHAGANENSNQATAGAENVVSASESKPSRNLICRHWEDSSFQKFLFIC